MQGLRSTLRSCWVSIVNALQEWQDSRARKGAFSGRPYHLPGAACCPTGFGISGGTACKILRPIAVRSLAQCASASPCERNWSAYEFVHSRCNRLGVRKAQQLVYVVNLRTIMKHSLLRSLMSITSGDAHKVEPDADDSSDSCADVRMS
jgi:hypothetical protein